MLSVHYLLFLVLLLEAGIRHHQRVDGFSVKKRSLDGDSARDMGDLAAAMKVIQRAKRAAFYAELRRPSWPSGEGNSYYGDEDWERPYPRRGYNSYDTPDFGDLFSSAPTDDDDEAGPGYSPVSLADQPLWSEVAENRVAAYNNNNNNNNGLSDNQENDEQKVSDDELADIFAEIEKDESKRTEGEKESLSEALLGPAANGVNPKAKDKRLNPEGERRSGNDELDDIKLSDLSPDQIDNLIQDVEEAQNGSDEVDEDDDDNHVSAEELGDIFGDGNDDNIDENDDGSVDEARDSEDAVEVEDGNRIEDAEVVTDKREDEVDDSQQELNKEWLIAQYLDGFDGRNDVITKKRKRSEDRSFLAPLEGDTSQSGTEDGPDDLATELAIAREDIKVLKTFLDKEDQENANLAYALNLATKSQTDRTDKYIDEEIKYIKKAIQNEMDIQEVKDVLNIAASLDVSASRDLDSSEELPDEKSLSVNGLQEFLEQSKRSDPELVDPDEVDVPDEDAIDDSDIASDMTDGDLVKALLASKLQKLLSQATINDFNKMPTSATGQGWYDRPVLPSVEDTENEPDVSSDLPIDLNTLEEVLADSLNKEKLPSEGKYIIIDGWNCTSYCCFLLQGSAPYIGLTADDCDRNYLQEAARLCQNKQGCDVDASRLFILMLRYQSYTQISPPSQCAEPCTREYVTGSQYDE
ncbi:hypothetical protein LSH36_861g00021 [Paralvinella palmiformis]|uniref:Uncharacterized protein n=1 Tax=Paralvinella palmiformis TaxID=53620 RepID=A0AAD9MU93_9ANNE|nr:hypothetical protein LSH36_861g00021 [Paralvinella palmiformis]